MSFTSGSSGSGGNGGFNPDRFKKEQERAHQLDERQQRQELIRRFRALPPELQEMITQHLNPMEIVNFQMEQLQYLQQQLDELERQAREIDEIPVVDLNDDPEMQAAMKNFRRDDHDQPPPGGNTGISF